MPTYEYRCTQCGHRFDVFQRIDEPPLTACERCGGELRKVFHPAGIVFKGSGFYATDSRTSAKKAEGGDKKKDDGAGGGSTEKKTDGKPAEKTGGSS